jgi:cytochrome P450
MTLTDIEALPLFDGCPPDDVASLLAGISGPRTAVEGETICAEGEPADRWWIVTEGVADVTVGGLYIATIGPGETIGELALLDDQPRAATVKAVTDMRLHEVDGRSFLDALLARPALAVAMLRQLARRLRATNQRPSPPIRPPAAPSLAASGDEPAIRWSDDIGSYVVTRYDDVHALIRSRALVGSIATMDADDGGPGHRMMIRRHGDDHLRLRRLMAKVFTPRAVTQWRERAEGIVEQLLRDAQERTELDVIADFALPLPAQIISEMLGMPKGDEARLRAWSQTLIRGLEPFVPPDGEAAIAEAGRAMGDYLDEVIADKRRTGGEDLLTALIRAEDSGSVLDDNEVRAQVVMLYIAGHETTLNLIGNGVVNLLRFPDQLEHLRAEPGLDANAVEEVLRFESPVQLTRRVAVEPIEIAGVAIAAGSHVTLSLASANRDPRKWGPTADVLDIGRPGANDHVSFGGGAHYCLGASLARLEATVALPRLLRRFPYMTAAYDEPNWSTRVALRGVESLPVTLR